MPARLRLLRLAPPVIQIAQSPQRHQRHVVFRTDRNLAPFQRAQQIRLGLVKLTLRFVKSRHRPQALRGSRTVLAKTLYIDVQSLRNIALRRRKVSSSGGDASQLTQRLGYPRISRAKCLHNNRPLLIERRLRTIVILPHSARVRELAERHNHVFIPWRKLLRQRHRFGERLLGVFRSPLPHRSVAHVHGFLHLLQRPSRRTLHLHELLELRRLILLSRRPQRYQMIRKSRLCLRALFPRARIVDPNRFARLRLADSVLVRVRASTILLPRPRPVAFLLQLHSDLRHYLALPGVERHHPFELCNREIALPIPCECLAVKVVNLPIALPHGLCLLQLSCSPGKVFFLLEQHLPSTLERIRIARIQPLRNPILFERRIEVLLLHPNVAQTRVRIRIRRIQLDRLAEFFLCSLQIVIPRQPVPEAHGISRNQEISFPFPEIPSPQFAAPASSAPTPSSANNPDYRDTTSSLPGTPRSPPAHFPAPDKCCRGCNVRANTPDRTRWPSYTPQSLPFRHASADARVQFPNGGPRNPA